MDKGNSHADGNPGLNKGRKAYPSQLLATFSKNKNPMLTWLRFCA